MAENIFDQAQNNDATKYHSWIIVEIMPFYVDMVSSLFAQQSSAFVSIPESESTFVSICT